MFNCCYVKMGEQTKKISFGFSKLAKKTAIVSSHLHKSKDDEDANKVELIDCLEGKSIKLKDPVKINQGPLIIPLTRQKQEKNVSQEELEVNSITLENRKSHNQLQNKDRSSDTNTELSGKKDNTDEIKEGERESKLETLDEIATREILEELKKKKTEEEEKRVFSVPLTSNAPSGEKESSLEDYDNVPVTEFGMAMLRGMGWAPGKGIGKTEKLVAPALPTPRPKGMGLGADTVLKSATGNKKSSNEELKMVKGSFVRVLAGPDKDAYGQIEGFDDESGRLIVKLALKNVSVSLNEFMVQLVDTNEFKKNSKVINVSKYEQYKEDEVKKESSIKREPKEEVGHLYKKGLDKEPSINSHEKHFENRSKSSKKYRSSSCESEEIPLKGDKSKSSTNTARYTSPKGSSHRSSRSPYSRNEGNEHPRSQHRTQSHEYQSTKYETSSKKHKSLKSDDTKHRSYSSDNSSDSSSSFKKSRSGNNKTNSSKHKRPAESKVVINQRSRSSDSSSSDSSIHSCRKKKNKHKKKKTSSYKYRSRSRSQSPRRHKHKKSKKHS